MTDHAALKAASDGAIKKDDIKSNVEEIAATDESVEYVDDLVEEVDEEIDIENELPADHKESSALGRKIATLFDHKDAQDSILLNTLDELSEIKKLLTQKDAPNGNEYVTRADIDGMAREATKKETKYGSDFKNQFWHLADKSNLSKEDAEEVGKILISDFNLNETGNGLVDGSTAFVRAKDAYFNKKTPLQNKKSSGVITKQTVATREPALPKLTGHAKAYIERLRKTKGAEYATKIHKTLKKDK